MELGRGLASLGVCAVALLLIYYQFIVTGALVCIFGNATIWQVELTYYKEKNK